MCKHILQKKNIWYYRRRIPEHARKLHLADKTNKARTELFFSLGTSDKAEAARRADLKTRQLDTLGEGRRHRMAVRIIDSTGPGRACNGLAGRLPLAGMAVENSYWQSGISGLPAYAAVEIA
jgi:hypothetical protein